MRGYLFLTQGCAKPQAADRKYPLGGSKGLPQLEIGNWKSPPPYAANSTVATMLDGSNKSATVIWVSETA
jgi:hypothetical protein